MSIPDTQSYTQLIFDLMINKCDNLIMINSYNNLTERNNMTNQNEKRKLKKVVKAVKNSPGNHEVIGKQIYSRPPNQLEEDSLNQMFKNVTRNKSYLE